MIVGIDATDAVFDNTRRGDDMRQTLESLATCHPHQQYMLYAPSLGAHATQLTGLLAHSNIHLKEPKRPPLLRNRWRSGKGILYRAHRHHIEVFHGMGGFLPRGVKKMGIGAVATIDSTAFKHRPQDYSLLQRWRLDRRYRKTCKLADVVIVPSERAKRDVAQAYGVEEQRIKVVYPCCGNDYAIAPNSFDIERVCEKYKLPRHFLLLVAPLEQASNLELAIEALQYVQKRGMMLVMIGHRNDYYAKCKKRAQNAGVARHLYRISHVHDEDLPIIYSLADATLHTWHYPESATSLLKSMTCGTPAIATSGGCMEEVGGNAATYVAPDDPEAMGRAIDTVLGDERRRSEMAARGREQARKFSAQRMADALNDIYHQLRD